MAFNAHGSTDCPLTPIEKLSYGAQRASGRNRVVLLLCGSFSPVTLAHVELLGEAHARPTNAHQREPSVC